MPEVSGDAINKDSSRIELNGSPLRRSAWRALIQDFSPLWFTWCMNSGALAGLLHDCPYRFSGIDILSNILFCVDLGLFAIFSLFFIARLVWFKSDAYHEITHNINELTFTTCWAIAWLTLTSSVAEIVSTASWGGYSFTIVSYVMWWFILPFNVSLLVWVFTILIGKHGPTSLSRLPTSIIIPAVSVVTVGATGAMVSIYAYNLSARLAVPMMIVSFNLTGAGILLGILLTSFLFWSLIVEGWPPPDQSGAIFILVGPMGQSATAMQLLGESALTYHRFADYNRGVFLTLESAKGVAATCNVLGLFMNGVGVIWLILGIYCMLERAIMKELRWTLAWNGIIFPNATLATSMLAFSITMDSAAYRVIAVIMIIVLIIVYLVNLVYTVLGISQGRLLIVKENPRVKKEREQ